MSVENKVTNYTPADLQATLIVGLFVLVCICFVALVHVFDAATRRHERIRRRIIREDYDAMQRWHDWIRRRIKREDRRTLQHWRDRHQDWM